MNHLYPYEQTDRPHPDNPTLFGHPVKLTVTIYDDTEVDLTDTLRYATKPAGGVTLDLDAVLRKIREAQVRASKPIRVGEGPTP